MDTTYTYWRYGRKYTESKSGTAQDVLQEAINDIEHNTACPESISVDGHIIYDEDAIREACDEADGGIVVDGSIVSDEPKQLL